MADVTKELLEPSVSVNHPSCIPKPVVPGIVIPCPTFVELAEPEKPTKKPKKNPFKDIDINPDDPIGRE